MKTINIIAGISFLLISLFSFAQSKAPATKSETIKVWGNCDMCKSHIEKAAKQAGASYALWNKDTKMLSVKYAATVTSDQKIQESIASAGYDTKDLSGNDQAYKNLDECCQYDRKGTAKGDKVKQLASVTGKSCCDKDEVCDKSLCNTPNMECCKNAAVKHACLKNPANSCCAK